MRAVGCSLNICQLDIALNTKLSSISFLNFQNRFLYPHHKPNWFFLRKFLLNLQSTVPPQYWFDFSSDFGHGVFAVVLFLQVFGGVLLWKPGLRSKQWHRKKTLSFDDLFGFLPSFLLKAAIHFVQVPFFCSVRNIYSMVSWKRDEYFRLDFFWRVLGLSANPWKHFVKLFQVFILFFIFVQYLIAPTRF